MLVTTLLALAGFGISADQVEDMVTRASRLQVEGRYDEAKTVLASALEQSTEVALQATILNNQASVEQDLGNANRAESNYRRAIAMLEKEYGPDSVQLARPLNNLGTLYFEVGKYTKSEQLRRRSLEIRKRVYGPNHPDVGLVLHNLGTVYLYERRYSEAEEMYRQALPMFGNNAGVVWNDLGVLAWMTGDRTSALANLERASASLEAPRERIKVMTNLATAYFDIGRRTDAENCWRSAIVRRFHSRQTSGQFELRHANSPFLLVASPVLYAHG